jgi:3-oxoacyl-[acyl-carrier protein] reductase
MKLLEGKNAVVTGGARGIGKSIVLAFAAQGANVAFSDLNLDENTAALENEIALMGVKGKAYASNAANFDDSQTFIDAVAAEFGTIDILVNNAGITRDNLLMRMTEADWDIVINVNLKSVFNMTKAVQKYMLKQKYGSIINMSSVVGIEGNAGQSNYSSSKAGLIGFTKSIAQELGSRNIRVNAIAPGFITTPMTDKLPEDVRKGWVQQIPLRREGKPEDVADVCIFLGSNLSAYVTGQVISVCGGMHT